MSVSRRHLFKSAITLAAATGLEAAVSRGSASQSPFRARKLADNAPTVSKQAAGYQEQPNGQQRCALCTHFVAPASCQVVIGTIVPNGWCRLFAPAAPP
jgi:hypothetical protein